MVEDYQEPQIEFTEAPVQEELEEIQWVDPEDVETSIPQPISEKATPGHRPKKSPPPVEFDPIPEEYQTPPPTNPTPRPVTKKRPPGSPPKASPAVKIEAVAEVEPQPGRIAVPVRRKRGGDIALVLVALGLIVAGTLYYRSRRANRQELPHIAEVNSVEGKDALENGRFDEAKVKLGRAAKAYRDLGEIDEAAVEAIQLADEASILADFERNNLKEIVEEVARLGEVEGLARFKAFYQGRGVLIETAVKSVTNRRVELVYHIFVGRGPTASKEGKLDLTNFALLKDKNLKPGEQVLFGARLDEISLDGNVWRITFQPDSGVLMTNAKALAIALPTEQNTK